MKIDVREYLGKAVDELDNIKSDPGNFENISDLLRPIGSCYETSDNDFNPNDVWAGTWVKVSYTYLESIGSAQKSGTIGLSLGSSATISASVPSGNTFLCWFTCGSTDNWCGRVYTPYESSTSATYWVGSYGGSGTNSFHGRYLYYKKVTRYRWQRTA